MNEGIPLSKRRLRGGKPVVKRGDIYYADLSPVIGSEQGGMRPVLIIQNNVGNKYSPTVIVAAITTKIEKGKMPTHVEVGADKGLEKNSVVLLEQIRTIDKQRLKDQVTHLDNKTMSMVDDALAISIGLSNQYKHI
ncbi:type II toxin-antitoxin system PemK/MazF family toxin [Alkalibacterium subtropicum]|uniref:type II toxin-antitoxin system PemK/MazF family toxin n=1 Tax=Alkalibacterium subtropicum TaxID=753702 RepID=UPI000B853CE4|nr:type II toxin-antitoxin system PemK/MazF family toxin [Alkalibacterium subtropicum]